MPHTRCSENICRLGEWIDESPGIVRIALSSICLHLKSPANPGILASDKRSRGGKVSKQEVRKAIKQKSSQDWFPGIVSRLSRVLSSAAQPLAFSTLTRAW